MEVNSSLFLNHVYNCSESTIGFYIIMAFLFTKIFLVLPPSIIVLYLGYQRWRQQRSFTTTSHSDFFSYHSSAMELSFALGSTFYFCGNYFGSSALMRVGYYLCSVVFPGETSFHILTCVERYLAVVHPVIYLRLRQSERVWIRNISCGCVWLLCFGWSGLTGLYYPDFPYILFFSFLVLALVFVSFCSLSVLRVLIRPGPGETGEERKRVSQSKQRAFNTIAAIMGVLLLCVLGFLICLALDNSQALSYIDGCLALLIGNIFTLPSSLVLPLFFLHRAEKLLCFVYDKN